MTQIDADVAIVGAGPGGSTLAALLARRGVAVALIDRDTFPRDKLCGEFLSYDALPVLDALGVEIPEAPHIARCRVVARRRVYDFDLPHSARGVSRMLLDDRLLRTAIAAGATLITTTATELGTTGDVALASAPAGGAPRAGGGDAAPPAVETTARLRARVVVGAWGRWGRFDQQLARSFV